MATVRIIITLKPGILDAAGQAVRQGLHALGYEQAGEVRVGRYVEITVPDGLPPEGIHQMCERFLANPLIEQWRFEGLDAPSMAASRPRARRPRPESRPSGRNTDQRGLH
ncbi:MAG TPA: phosphoribosylformylglycinamidine synthase subunit PurS [bacterium]|nr:phosphoribosylformylglycinamidine synthase subunit PurS [bacterium]